jgi:hypothetical protein
VQCLRGHVEQAFLWVSRVEFEQLRHGCFPVTRMS